MRIALMIEGQEDVSWKDWTALAEAVDGTGYDALFRSDHYLSLMGFEHERDATDAWTVLAGLAAVTDQVRLGTLVSPVTFRHPSQLAKIVATVDHISGGRVELGMGAGWNEREHAAYGFAFPEVGERFDRLEEQVEIVSRSWSEDELSFAGDHYSLDGVTARPRPVQSPPTLLLGGSAGPRASALAARYAAEYNSVPTDHEGVRERRANLDRACEAVERDPADLPLSMMVPLVVGETRAEVEARAATILGRLGRDGTDVPTFLEERAGTWLAGTPSQVLDQIGRLGDLGVSRVMLQHLDHTDLETVELVAEQVIPNL
ncbi:MAG: TIGR03560 family F420-dependent LLM class oxidoreductase [Actinobacteria bacterium]|nr:TIGR03560 family F420-dependent LLM class oxidoreductase [Actinomycetota bacterium]